MQNSNWKIIAASLAGTSHVSKNESCADAFVHEIFVQLNGEKVLLIVASDGAGSAKAGKAAAETTCASLKREIQMLVERDGRFQVLAFDNALGWIKRLQNDLAVRARAENLSVTDYACTLLAAIAGETETIFMQLGDGAIVYAAADAPDDYRLFAQPQQGEYANSTNFVTDETAADSLKFEIIKNRIGELAVFTDGLQRIALKFNSETGAQITHQPFFRPMFAPLRTVKAEDNAKLENLQKQLSSFLDSSKINERTDDDKTLILASRF